MTTAKTMGGKEAKLQALLKGLQTVLPQGSSLTVDGTQFTQAQMVAQIDTVVSLFAAKATAQSQATAAVAALHAGLPSVEQFASKLTAALKQQFGERNPLLAGFGISPPKVKQALTVGQKAVAAAKQSATRKARGVMSAKKRSSIPAANTPTQVTIGADGKATLADPVTPVVASSVVPATLTQVSKS